MWRRLFSAPCSCCCLCQLLPLLLLLSFFSSSQIFRTTTTVYWPFGSARCRKNDATTAPWVGVHLKSLCKSSPRSAWERRAYSFYLHELTSCCVRDRFPKTSEGCRATSLKKVQTKHETVDRRQEIDYRYSYQYQSTSILARRVRVVCEYFTWYEYSSTRRRSCTTKGFTFRQYQQKFSRVVD